jgi:hypothetical protein
LSHFSPKIKDSTAIILEIYSLESIFVYLVSCISGCVYVRVGQRALNNILFCAEGSQKQPDEIEIKNNKTFAPDAPCAHNEMHTRAAAGIIFQARAPLR